MSPGGPPAKEGTRVPIRLTAERRDTILKAAAAEGIANLSDATAILATRAAEAVLAAAGPLDPAAVGATVRRFPRPRRLRRAARLWRSSAALQCTGRIHGTNGENSR
jgi:hypothetical protein